MQHFNNKTLFLDTAPLIYFMEAKEPYYTKVLPLFKANDKGNFQFITSILTLEEVLVVPFRKHKPVLVQKYEHILSSSTNLHLYDIGYQVAKKAAELRATYQIKTPDALQFATAIIHKADFFLTNDKRLKKITEVPVITLDDL